ncbi:unnamed protein product [Allacma fusca]|uniref:Secreted protein n=1 Tax=Allacma fusca TaxID=39272 RepID=A0A8J2KN75_9HEXA|nr:unnamed protein product [Allacma fusca]
MLGNVFVFFSLVTSLSGEVSFPSTIRKILQYQGLSTDLAGLCQKSGVQTKLLLSLVMQNLPWDCHLITAG